MATPPDESGTINFEETSGIVVSTPRRAMKFYRVHEPELHNLSTAHGLMVIFFSAGSACLGFGLDVAKDIAFASGELSPEAKVINSMIKPACFWAAGILYLCGVWASFKRRGSIQRIKRESGEIDTLITKCIKVWHQFKATPPSAAPSDTQSPPNTQ